MSDSKLEVRAWPREAFWRASLFLALVGIAVLMAWFVPQYFGAVLLGALAGLGSAIVSAFVLHSVLTVWTWEQRKAALYAAFLLFLWFLFSLPHIGASARPGDYGPGFMMPLMALAQAFGLVIAAGFLRASMGLHIAQPDPKFPPDPPERAGVFHVLVAAIVMTLIWLEISVPPDRRVFRGLEIAGYALSVEALIACWAVLGGGRSYLRWPAALVLSLVYGALIARNWLRALLLCDWTPDVADEAEVVFLIVTHVSHTLFLGMFLRQAVWLGYRWIHR